MLRSTYETISEKYIECIINVTRYIIKESLVARIFITERIIYIYILIVRNFEQRQFIFYSAQIKTLVLSTFLLRLQIC